MDFSLFAVTGLANTQTLDYLRVGNNLLTARQVRAARPRAPQPGSSR